MISIMIKWVKRTIHSKYWLTWYYSPIERGSFILFKKGMGNYHYFSPESVSDIDANERFKEKLDFLGVSQIRLEAVHDLKDLYENNRNLILDSFYDRLQRIPQFNEVIQKHSNVERLKKYLTNILKAYFKMN